MRRPHPTPPLVSVSLGKSRSLPPHPRGCPPRGKVCVCVGVGVGVWVWVRGCVRVRVCVCGSRLMVLDLQCVSLPTNVVKMSFYRLLY